jgi:hypothetical protein
VAQWIDRNYRAIMLTAMLVELVLISILVLQGSHR